MSPEDRERDHRKLNATVEQCAVVVRYNMHAEQYQHAACPAIYLRPGTQNKPCRC
jgi:hypothetical protein